LKTILLFRHAKSDWQAESKGDHDRPLNKRGRKAAKLMGRFLALAQELPDLVLCSSALRARETLRLADDSGDWNCEKRETADLYAASPRSVLELIRTQDDRVGRLMLVGHEPTLSLLGGTLIGNGQMRVPTATLARIDLAADCWADVDADKGELVWLVKPKLLERIGFGT
jgi:phosphohistidine phosphatase